MGWCWKGLHPGPGARGPGPEAGAALTSFLRAPNKERDRGLYRNLCFGDRALYSNPSLADRGLSIGVYPRAIELHGRGLGVRGRGLCIGVYGDKRGGHGRGLS